MTGWRLFVLVIHQEKLSALLPHLQLDLQH